MRNIFWKIVMKMMNLEAMTSWNITKKNSLYKENALNYISAENILSDLEKEEKFLQQKNISHVVFLKVFRYINTRKPNFIESFNFHETSLDVTLSHKFLFIKKIVHFYVMIKLKHMAKIKNLALSV